MSGRPGFGLSRREMEREVQWMLRGRMPDDPNQFAKRLCEIVVTLIDKNNRALAESMQGDDPGEEDF